MPVLDGANEDDADGDVDVDIVSEAVLEADGDAGADAGGRVDVDADNDAGVNADGGANAIFTALVDDAGPDGIRSERRSAPSEPML